MDQERKTGYDSTPGARAAGSAAQVAGLGCGSEVDVLDLLWVCLQVGQELDRRLYVAYHCFGLRIPDHRIQRTKHAEAVAGESEKIVWSVDDQKDV